MDRSSRYRYPSVVEVAVVLAQARFWLPWELEARTRHAIRRSLILQGMAWRRADWLGHSLVARGRIENGSRLSVALVAGAVGGELAAGAAVLGVGAGLVRDRAMAMATA
jgi:hypothetical protein